MTVVVNNERINGDPSAPPARGSGLIALSPADSGANISAIRCNVQDQPLDADAALYVNAMVVNPDFVRRTVINQLFLDLKGVGNHGTDNIFSQLDFLYPLAAHTQQAGLLDIKRDFDATAVNAPAFVVDRGFTGGTDEYIRTMFTPSIDGVNYAQNFASLGVYVRTDQQENTRAMGGGNVLSLFRSSIVIPRFGSGLQFAVVNGEQSTNFAVADSLGLSVSRRRDGANVTAFRNGLLLSTTAAGNPGLTTQELYILARNQGGTADSFYTGQIALAFAGAELTATEQLNLFNAIEDYMDAIGAGVVA